MSVWSLLWSWKVRTYSPCPLWICQKTVRFPEERERQEWCRNISISAPCLFIRDSGSIDRDLLVGLWSSHLHLRNLTIPKKGFKDGYLAFILQHKTSSRLLFKKKTWTQPHGEGRETCLPKTKYQLGPFYVVCSRCASQKLPIQSPCCLVVQNTS